MARLPSAALVTQRPSLRRDASTSVEVRDYIAVKELGIVSQGLGTGGAHRGQGPPSFLRRYY